MIKRITLFGLALVACFAMNAQVIFEEDFTGKTGTGGVGSLETLGWSVYTEDNYQVAPDVNYIDEAWKIVNMNPVGEAMVTTSWFTSAGQADRWAVTPAIELTGENAFLLYGVLEANPGFPEAYEVLVSTTGNTPADFTGEPLWVDDPAPADGLNFIQRTISLEEYVGETIYIAFHAFGYDGYLLLIDNIVVASLPENDISVDEVVMGDYAQMNADTAVEVALTNRGGNTIETATIDWTDGTNTYSSEYTLNLGPTESTVIMMMDPFVNETLDPKTITVTAVSVNGEEDVDPSDNEASKTVKMVTELVDKAVVIEEGTGAWCGWCPRGFVAMEYMYDHPEQYPNFIGIGVHAGDVMAISTYANSANFPGYPSANVDRVLNGVDVGLAEWEGFYAQRDITPPADMELELAYDKATREVQAVATSNFYTNLSNANYRMGLVFIEDGLSGEGANWAQENYYSGGTYGPMGGWENLPSKVYNYVFDRVAIALVGGYAGQGNSVPSSDISAGDSFDYTFNYTLPAYRNAQNVSVVALLLNVSTGEIVNATEESLHTLGVDKQIENTFTMYPNPATDVVNVSFSAELNGQVQMNIYNMAGQVVKSEVFKNIVPGESLQVNVDSLASGEYLISFSTAQGTNVKKLVVK